MTKSSSGVAIPCRNGVAQLSSAKTSCVAHALGDRAEDQQADDQPDEPDDEHPGRVAKRGSKDRRGSFGMDRIDTTERARFARRPGVDDRTGDPLRRGRRRPRAGSVMPSTGRSSERAVATTASAAQRVRLHLPRAGRTTADRRVVQPFGWPRLLLGPVLRHVGEHDATVWVETTARASSRSAPGPSWVACRRSPVAGHHYALVVVTGLERRSSDALRGAARRPPGLAGRRTRPSRRAGSGRSIRPGRSPCSTARAASPRPSSARATRWSTPTCSSRTRSG